MTLKEIERQIKIANSAPVKPDGTSDRWDLLPRVYYNDLPKRLKNEVDKISIDSIKAFLYEYCDAAELGKVIQKAKKEQGKSLDDIILEVKHTARYLIESTTTEQQGTTLYEQMSFDRQPPLSLIAEDFVKAWQRVAGLSPIIIPNPNTKFDMIRQGTATNALTKTKAIINENTVIDPFTNTATISNGDFSLTIPGFNKIGSPSISTWQLLDMVTAEFNRLGGRTTDIAFSLDYYMEKRKIKDRKEARKQVDKDLEILRISAISFKEPREKGEPIGYYNLNISEGAGRSKKGVIMFSFAPKFAKLLAKYPPMPYPQQLYTLNAKRNPNSYFFLRKISEHKNMNIGKPNEDIISVKTLVESSPNIPTYKKVMETDRHLDARIIAPFERDMDALSDTLKWEYCHSKGNKLTDAETSSMTYQLFISCLIKISWVDYPGIEEKRQKRLETAKSKKGKSTKKTKKEGGNTPHKGG